jgi:hypothetical protein
LRWSAQQGSIWVGIYLAQTYGIRPADGGVLAPLPVRLAWGIGVASLGVGFAAAMWLYGRCYIGKVVFDPQTKRLHIFTPRFIGSAEHIVDVSNIVAIDDHSGQLTVVRMDGAVLSVNAPWRSIKVAGRRLPLILDGQGNVLHHDLMQGFFGTRWRPRGRAVRS